MDTAASMNWEDNRSLSDPNYESKKDKELCCTADRISNLPCHVIDHILKNLPLRDAVRTSILSSGWRYKWVTIPYLVFDGNFKRKSLGKHKTESIIYQVLLLHKGPIVKFTLNVPDLKCSPAIGHWLRFLSNQRLKVLFLQCPSDSSINDLFTLDHLKHLYLAGAKLKSPLAFKGFSRLVRLDLDYVCTRYEEFKRFISKCPILEYLNLYSCLLVGGLEIDVPNVKSFYFSDTLCSQNIFVNAEISIALKERTKQAASQDSDNKLVKFFGRISSVKRLKVNGDFLELLGGAERVPEKLPQDLSSLTVLQLPDIDFIPRVEVACVLCLIRSSPILRSLEITSVPTRDNEEEAAAQFLKAQQKCELTLSHLENVKINGLSVSESEMEFVKFLLSAATALLKLEITSRFAAATKEGSKMFKELLSFRRASTKAQIIFQDPA